MCVGVGVFQSMSAVVDGMTQSRTGDFLPDSEPNVVYGKMMHAV